MAEDFDLFLASALGPDARDPDRIFAARVQARIALEDQLAERRRSLLANLGKQLLALFAVAAGVWVVCRAAPVAAWFAESPALALAILVTAFACLVALFSVRLGADDFENVLRR